MIWKKCSLVQKWKNMFCKTFFTCAQIFFQKSHSFFRKNHPFFHFFQNVIFLIKTFHFLQKCSLFHFSFNELKCTFLGPVVPFHSVARGWQARQGSRASDLILFFRGCSVQFVAFPIWTIWFKGLGSLSRSSAPGFGPDLREMNPFFRVSNPDYTCFADFPSPNHHERLDQITKHDLELKILALNLILNLR